MLLIPVTDTSYFDWFTSTHEIRPYFYKTHALYVIRPKVIQESMNGKTFDFF